MNKDIKNIIEKFDFSSIDSKKYNINVYNQILQEITKKIAFKEPLSKDEYGILIVQKGFYKPESNSELIDLIKYSIEQFGENCNLNWIDVSGLEDLSGIFWNSPFNGDISQWDVSNAKLMNKMFFCTKNFNGNISKWDTSNVADMSFMFAQSVFNSDISKWNVSKVETMRSMFETSKFNGDIGNWDVSSVTNMRQMFAYKSEFTGDISKWDVSNVTNFQEMFYANGYFNRDISDWKVRGIINAEGMFRRSVYDKHTILFKWNVSVASNIKNMFAECPLESIIQIQK